MNKTSIKKEPLLIGEDNVPSGSQWQKILLEIYRYAPNLYGYSNRLSNNDDSHPLAKKLGIGGHELMLGTSFLGDQELIEDNVTGGEHSAVYWTLTKKGFDVALDLKKFHMNNLQQKAVASFTVVVALTAVFQFLNELNLIKPLTTLITYTVILLISIWIMLLSKSNLEMKIDRQDKEKISGWNKMIRIQGEYFFAVGISLVVVGATVIFNNPYGIIAAGIIILLTGVVLKVIEK